jgi:signal transduction histidine kinase
VKLDLRARLIAGIALWTVGVLAVSFVGRAIVARGDRSWIWTFHHTVPILAGGLAIAAALFVVRRGLSPFRTIRARLAAVRDGRTARLEGDHPIEIMPLVDDLNALLEERERRVAQAVAKAGDLAHGLKTPLAVVAQDIECVDAAGQHELAASLRQQVERMRRQIESHLAQARATAGTVPGARANVTDAARGLARTMERLYTHRGLAITVNTPVDAVVRVPLEDLEEMLGNLLDNACKWAKSRVTVSAAFVNASVVIDVDDDGAGLDPSMRQRVLQRGVRADETAPGSGLGLAIVRDLIEAYGGSVALDGSPDGGIRARLTFPAKS